jgi:tryptophan-rich sensory protein
MKALAGWLAACFAAALIGAMATRHAPEFYGALVRPDWAPPAWIFAPVWTTLYALMGVAAWRVWRKAGWGTPIGLFCAQLVLNALWSWLFFAWRMGAAAFGEIVLLGLLIAATLAAFWRIDRLAGALLLPYLAWVGFATALTWAVWRANPAILG